MDRLPRMRDVMKQRGQIGQIRSVLSNPASVLKSNLELSRNLVGG
jgi:hypothetical protein